MAFQTLEKPILKSGLWFEKIAVDDYEKVLQVSDEKRGLKAIIAMHNTALGPTLGGVRIYPYASSQEALEDVLRLSQGMTYKSAVACSGFGGGKSVIIADPKQEKTPELLLAFGEAVEMLGGMYICAEDVGCNVNDVKVIRRSTKYVVGLPNAKSSGDPCGFTAWGVFRGIQSVAKRLFGTDSLEGRSVAIQGLGGVGSCLAQYLFWAGADLIFSDLDEEKVRRFADRFGARAVGVDQILKTECDILSPCAMGGVINDQTLPFLQCKAIAGAANNQLLLDSHAEALKERGILYAPDFVINAGGLLNVAAELEKEGYSPTIARQKTYQIYDTLLTIYEIAEKNGESTHAAALGLANYRIKHGIGKRTTAPVFHHLAE